MDLQQHGKVLVAIDGSASSIHTVKYLSGIPAFREKEVVLFSVYEGLQERYCAAGVSSAYLHTPEGGVSLETVQQRNIEEELDKVGKVLLDGGFEKERVVVRLLKRQQGIARDIIAEAGKGYDLVVAGRKGVGRIEQLLFGSVAAKLVEKTTFAPLLLVGRKALGKKLLVGVDGSEGSWEVIEFLGRNLSGAGFEKITLLHVMRGGEGRPDPLGREKMNTSMTLMKNRLAVLGVDPLTLDYCIDANARSRAETILNHAEIGEYNSIAVGRRGSSNVPDFSMGRVAAKVLQLSRGLAIWVVA